jgi:hypothetical protein
VRIRFSLKLIFVALTTLAVMLYFWIVRPTSVANSFVAAVDEMDYGHAWPRLPVPMQDELSNRTGTIDRFHAEVFPRGWDDVWKCQRRIIVHVASHSDDGHTEWITDFDLIASLNGLTVKSEEMRISRISIQLPARNETFDIPDYTLVP